jgi:eukaryotic-like serine/threonine-protein kinase
MTIQAGTRLGPYEITGSVGAGGMGEVWRAKDTRLDREVAVKVLPPGLAQDEQFLQRFEREAKAISQLNHPNVCTLFDVGEVTLDGPGGSGSSVRYLVMELLEGGSLADRIRRGPLPLSDVLKLGREIALALDAAHRQGITHRDLKPGNVMLTRSGAKLLDFGLAKTASEGPAPVDGLTNMATEAKPLTTEGTILGTFQYMSPEQLEGTEADARTDIFALGAVLYEMATGRRAFEGGSKTSLIAAIVSSQPQPISTVVPMSPPALDHVVRRCLEKNPDDRWQSAQDVAAELQWISEAGSQAGTAAPLAARRKTRARFAWVAVLALLTATAVTGWFALRWKRALDDRGVIRASILPPEGTTFEFSDVDSGSLVLSPDGRRLVFSAVSKGGGRMLYVRPLDSTASRPLAGTDGATFPFWSPDGRFVAYFADRKLMKVAADGGTPLAICGADSGRGGTWNREGVIVFAPTSQGGLFRVSASGGSPTPVTELDPSTSEGTHRHPFFLEDGRHFLFTATTGFSVGSDVNASAIYAASLDSPERKLVVKARSKGIVSRGHLLYVNNNVLMAQPFHSTRLEVTGEPFLLGVKALYSADMSNGVFTASANGVLAAYEKDVSRLVLKELSRSGQEIATVGEPAYYGFIRLSPDGRRLAVTLNEESQAGSDIWIIDLAIGSRTRLTFDQRAAGPVWSPDGRKIAYARTGEGAAGSQIVVQDATGGGAPQVLLADEMNNEPWDWSPDGKHLLFNRSSAGDFDLWVLPLDGEKPFPLVTGPASDGWGHFSPDGRWVAYISNESGRWQAYATRFPGARGKWQLTSDTDGAYWIVDWVNGGRDLVHITSGQMLSILSLRVTGDSIEVGQRHRLMRSGGDSSWAVSADGSRFIIAASPSGERDLPLTLVSDWLAGVK